MEQTSSEKNPYGKKGGDTARLIIDRVIDKNFKSNVNQDPSEKSIGEMEEEIMALVNKHVKFLE
ncbi:hypothetical protein ACFLZZ_03855 [Nanoarchaeota archaeon]